MGTGLIAIGAMLLAAVLAGYLTASGRCNVWVATIVSIPVVVVLQNIFVPVFPWDSPYLLGAMGRLAAMALIPTLIGAAIGHWIKKI